MSELPTVKVKSGDSFAIINESDYDESVHGKKLPNDYEDKKPSKKADEKADDKSDETKAEKETK